MDIASDGALAAPGSGLTGTPSSARVGGVRSSSPAPPSEHNRFFRCVEIVAALS